MTQTTNRVSINLDIPHLDPTSENLQRVKDLLLYALRDMATNNGHLIDAPRDYALAQLVTGMQTCSPASAKQLGTDAALCAAARELAEDAEVL